MIVGSGRESGIFADTHAGRKVKSEANSASNAALSRSVGTNDHVQVRTGTEFDKVIGDEVLKLNAHDRSRHVSLTVIRYSLHRSENHLLIRISD